MTPRIHCSSETSYHSLGTTFQTFFNSPRCLLMQPILHQLFYGDLTGYSIKGLSKVQVESIHCSLLMYQASRFIIDFVKLIKHDIPLVEPYCLLLMIFLSLVYLEMVSRISCSTTFPGIEVKPTLL